MHILVCAFPRAPRPQGLPRRDGETLSAPFSKVWGSLGIALGLGWWELFFLHVDTSSEHLGRSRVLSSPGKSCFAWVFIFPNNCYKKAGLCSTSLWQQLHPSLPALREPASSGQRRLTRKRAELRGLQDVRKWA